MTRNFNTEGNEWGDSFLSRAASSCGLPNQGGPGSSAARRPSRAFCSGGSVRYQQSGFTNTASRPLRWTAQRGNPGGFLA